MCMCSEGIWWKGKGRLMGAWKRGTVGNNNITPSWVFKSIYVHMALSKHNVSGHRPAASYATGPPNTPPLTGNRPNLAMCLWNFGHGSTFVNISAICSRSLHGTGVMVWFLTNWRMWCHFRSICPVFWFWWGCFVIAIVPILLLCIGNGAFNQEDAHITRAGAKLRENWENHKENVAMCEAADVTPPGETGQWGPRPSHCGHWHWTVTVDLSPVQFRVALVWSPRLLVWLSSVPIQGYLLEQCPVAMTLIPLLVTNKDFLFTIHVWDSSRFVTILFGTAAFQYYTSSVWSSKVLKFWSAYSLGYVPHRVLYWIWIGLPSRGYPANVFKKL